MGGSHRGWAHPGRKRGDVEAATHFDVVQAGDPRQVGEPQADMGVVASAVMELDVAFEDVVQVVGGRADPQQGQVDVDEIDPTTWAGQLGKVVDDALLEAAVVRQDMAQHHDVVAASLEPGRVGSTNPKIDVGGTRSRAGSSRDRVRVCVDARDVSFGPHDLREELEHAPRPAADVGDSGTWPEADLWTKVGIVSGARVADIGCGPGSVLELLAQIVGPQGHVSGVDADPDAIAAAASATASAANVDLRVGRADATGLETGSYDVVMLRHVLAHNGGLERGIVDHLAQLVRPGGWVYLVDVDLSLLRISPTPRDLDDVFERYVEFHRGRGNDPHVGLRLADLAHAAGLDDIEMRGRFDITPLPAGMRPPPVAAAQAMLADGVISVDDIRRWTTALEILDGDSVRPTLFNPTFIALGRRPD